MQTPTQVRQQLDSLRWRRDYECGHHTVDSQHQELFAGANALIEAALTGPLSLVIERLDVVIMHVIAHFRDEERILERLGYSGLAAHIREHAQILEGTLTLRDQIQRGGSDVVQLIQYLARDVIANHMIETDRPSFATAAAA